MRSFQTTLLFAATLIASYSATVGTAIARQGAPPVLQYQARLLNTAGQPLTATGLSITFRIWDAASGGTSIYTESQTLDVVGGLLSAPIGTVNPLPTAIFATSANRWLGITVGADAEMTPRQRLGSTAYAIRADSARAADDVPNADITPKSITVGGLLVIDASGNWVGNPTGLMGPAGPAGPVGPVGPAGPQGLPGAPGADGAQGPAGAPGADGAPGPQGPAGADGAMGPAGPVGPTGPTGPTGATGPTGPAGPQGLPGATGADGAQGPQGTPGTPGAAGAQGPQGPVGPEGASPFDLNAGNAVLDSGKLGVGTTTPTGKITASTNPDVVGFEHDVGPVTIGSKVSLTGVGIFGTLSDHALQIRTNDAMRIQVTKSGDVGINTSDPIAKLDVATSDAGLGISHTRGASTLATSIGDDGFARLGTQSNNPLRLVTNGTDQVSLSQNGDVNVMNGDLRVPVGNIAVTTGKVGVGTTTPQALLHVKGTGAFRGQHVAFFESDGDNSDGIAIQVKGSTANGGINSQNNLISFYGSSTTQIGGVAGFDKTYDGLSGTVSELETKINAILNLNSQPRIDPTVFLDFGNKNFTVNNFNLGQVDFGNFTVGKDGGFDGIINLLTGFINIPGESINLNNKSLGIKDIPLPPLPIPSMINNYNIADLVSIPVSTSYQNAIKDLGCWCLANGFDQFITMDPLTLATAVATYGLEIECRDGGVTYNSTGADYAEWLPKRDANEKFTFGTIVGVKGGRVSKVTDGAEQLMPVSLAPVVVGNTPPAGQESQYVKVGFMGQVPVLVMGGANAGDYILPSGKNDGSGIAVAAGDLKVSQMGQIIGRALEASKNDRVDLVNTLIGVKTNEWAEISQRHDSRIAELESEVSEQANTLATMEERILRLEAAIAATRK